jgi:pimeloyl-ACP methyl ester carboxylesterase
MAGCIPAIWRYVTTTLTEIMGSGHPLQIEKSDQFNRVVVEFLRN